MAVSSRYLIVALAVLYSTSSARADDPPSPTDPLNRRINLAEEMSLYGRTAMHDEGKEWDQPRDRRFTIKLDASDAISELRTRDEPAGLVFSDNKLRLTLDGRIYGERYSAGSFRNRVISSGGGFFPPAESLGYYQQVHSAFIGSNCATNPNAPGCVAAIQALTAFFSQSTADIQAGKQSGILNGQRADLIQTLQDYHHTLYAPSPSAMRGYLHSVSASRSEIQIVSLVAMWGKRLSDGYDDRRAELGIFAGGGIGAGELMNIARRNTQLSFDGSGSNGIFGGICRDIASFQGELWEAAGGDDVYVIDYSTDNGGGHASVIGRGRKGATHFFHVNYEEVRESQGYEGSTGIDPGDRAHTLSFGFSKPGGHTVDRIPSDMYKFLIEAAGGDITGRDPLARATHSIGAINLKSSNKEETLQVRVLGGRDAAEASYLGIAGDVSWGRDGFAPGKAGIVLITQRRKDTKVYHDMVYLDLDQKWITSPFFSLDRKSLEARVEGRVMAGVMVSRTRGGDSDVNGRFTAALDLRSDIGLRVDQAFLNGDIRLTHRGGLQVGLPGWTDITNAQRLMVMPYHVYAETEARATLHESKDHRVEAFLDVLAVISQISVRLRVEGGIAVDNVAFSLSFEGRPDRNDPAFYDNSVQRLGAHVRARPLPWLSADASGYMSLEDRRNLSAMLNGQIDF